MFALQYIPVNLHLSAFAPEEFKDLRCESCSTDTEMNERMIKLEQNVEAVTANMRTLLNLISGIGIDNYRFQQNKECEENRQETLVTEATENRKRKPQPAVQGYPKRAKTIIELEQKLAADQKENAELEDKVVKLRKQVAELKEARIRFEKEKEERQKLCDTNKN